MTVAELIKKLQSMPPDAQVETEGCDCIGRAEGVNLDGDTVLITRRMDDRDRARASLLYPPDLSLRNFKAEFEADVVDDTEVEEAIKD